MLTCYRNILAPIIALRASVDCRRSTRGDAVAATGFAATMTAGMKTGGSILGRDGEQSNPSDGFNCS